MHGELGRLYDAIENPRRSRGELPILRDSELRAYLDDVRQRTLEVLSEVEVGPDADDPLLRDGFVYEMLLAHELPAQRDDAAAAADGRWIRAALRDEPAPLAEPLLRGPEMAFVEAGTYAIGAGDGGFAYDNERRRHAVELEAFEIDRTPVTNGEYLGYMEETGAEPPLYWERDGADDWVRTAMGRRDPVDPSHPVIHVSWHEADAFARWAGKRLPTEQEWEAACVGADPERANLDQLAFGTAPAGAYSDAATDCGAVQMLGDVWEWTSSDFGAYPGFEAFPYPRVLRGLLRERLQGAARWCLGDAPRRDTAELPQLGPTAAPPDLRRHPLREGRELIRNASGYVETMQRR